MPQTFLTDDAKADFRVIIRRSRNQFGREAAKRYQKLINISILAIARNPDLINSKRYDSARKPVRIYHTRHSRNDAAINGVTVRTPRHIIVYYVKPDGPIDILRLLHDSMDIERNL